MTLLRISETLAFIKCGNLFEGRVRERERTLHTCVFYSFYSNIYVLEQLELNQKINGRFNSLSLIQISHLILEDF